MGGMLDDGATVRGDAGERTARLIAEAIAGDAAATEELLADSEPALRQALTGQIPASFRSAFDVDDVIQVTFVEAFLRIGTFTPRGPGSFQAWLTTLARNNLKDALKELRAEKRIPRHRLVPAFGDSGSHEGLLALLGASATTPSGGAARMEAKSWVEDAIGRLPPDYEKVVRLIDLEGHIGPSAAAALGRSVGAVYMLRLRAHDRLRELLGSSGNFFTSGA